MDWLLNEKNLSSNSLMMHWPKIVI